MVSHHEHMTISSRHPIYLDTIHSYYYVSWSYKHSGWNLIFYTGKEPLAPDIEESNTNVRVIKGRPNLSSLIPNVVYGHENGQCNDPSFQLYEDSEVQCTHVKRLDNHVMSSWGMMYCGGSQPVISTLEKVSINYNIDLHVDSFAW